MARRESHGNLFILRSAGERQHPRTLTSLIYGRLDAQRAFLAHRTSSTSLNSANSDFAQKIKIVTACPDCFCKFFPCKSTQRNEVTHFVGKALDSWNARPPHRPAILLRLNYHSSRTTSNSSLIFSQLERNFLDRFNGNIGRDNQEGSRIIIGVLYILPPFSAALDAVSVYTHRHQNRRAITRP